MTIQPWDLVNGDFQEHLTKLCLEAPLPSKKTEETVSTADRKVQKGERAA